MKIIIIENELYLAQSIASKLTEHNFQIEIYRSPKEAMHTQGDVYLLSTHIPGQSISPLISKYKDKIIILMVNYIKMIPWEILSSGVQKIIYSSLSGLRNYLEKLSITKNISNSNKKIIFIKNTSILNSTLQNQTLTIPSYQLLA